MMMYSARGRVGVRRFGLEMEAKCLCWIFMYRIALFDECESPVFLQQLQLLYIGSELKVAFCCFFKKLM